VERRLHSPRRGGAILNILVVDESRVLPWLVKRLARDRVEVLEADSFDDAMAMVSQRAIDAAIVSVTPAFIPWRDFQGACAARSPAIPVLYESCLATTLGALGLEPCEGWAAVLAKPASRGELEGALELLFSAVGRAHGAIRRGAEIPVAVPNPG
jgi:DNA-binding NtrC family response regulator